MQDEALFLPVAAAYDRWSSFYDAYDNPMVFGASQVVDDLSATVGGKGVVEFGCGTGRNLAHLKRGGAKDLIGCDLSMGMLEQARARDPQFLLFRQDMTQPVPLADRCADLVLFCLTLEHVGDLTGPLREARRLLREGGEIVMIEIHPFLSLNTVSAHFRDGDSLVRMPTFAHQFSDYIAACAAAGLTLRGCREWRPCDFHGPVPEKVFKRGAETPLLVQLTAAPAEAP